MALTKFAQIPDASGYTVEDAAADVISIKLDGGASRFRRDRIGSNSKVSCRWTLDPDGYRYFRAFYRFLTEKGAQPFLIDLVLDTQFPQEHTAHFVPGTVRLTEQRGHMYSVTAELEVQPTAFENEEDELNLVALYIALGPGYATLENTFDQLINVQIPGDLT